jgi:hypothetical protein
MRMGTRARSPIPPGLVLNTPAIPDYTSTHSVLGGAASEVLRRFFHDDDVPFTTTSGVPFAGITRSFASFSQAADENGESRIYAGIHFRFAVDDGIRQGKKIGAFALTHALQPIVGTTTTIGSLRERDSGRVVRPVCVCG